MPNMDKSELDQGHILTLYVVNKASEGIPSKTHFQKIMYLIAKSMGNDPRSTLMYRPHYFGPYSEIVADWRETLIESGWLNKNNDERVTIPPFLKSEVDRIDFGDPMVRIRIESIVESLTSLSHDELLLLIYADDIARNEGMTENSSEKNRIMSNRVKTAISMVRKGKVSMERGAELADIDVQAFMQMVRKVKYE